MKSELKKELHSRGTAEISGGIVNQVTQAIDEKESSAKYLILGELREQGIIPIDEACSKCDHLHFDSVAECQEFQGKEAKARGFNKVICPEQFVKGGL